MNDAAATVKSINCTNCGAGLPVLGGGRVVTQVCGYCGASLDATDNFRVLDVYAGMERPETPFQLGMEGTLDGVAFTIVGIKGMVEDGYASWVDHMLYSPTHGYAWLTLEDGHCVFTRKRRDLPSGSWLSDVSVEIAEHKPSRAYRGRNYGYYQTTNWRVDFVEGAFNYRPECGDSGISVSLVSWSSTVPEMLSYVAPARDDAEREIEVSTYAGDAPEAFGVVPPKRKGVHPLQTYEGGKHATFYRLWFAGMVAASILLLIAIAALQGGRESLLAAQVSVLPRDVTFEVTDTARPVRVSLETNLDNSWAEFGMSVVSPGGAPVVDTVFPLSYYWGYSDGERWSEGSQGDSVMFLPPETGTYRVALSAPEGEAVDTQRIETFDLEVRQRVMTIRWPIIAIIVFLIALAGTFVQKMSFLSRRASGSDWTEDDD